MASARTSGEQAALRRAKPVPRAECGTVVQGDAAVFEDRHARVVAEAGGSEVEPGQVRRGGASHRDGGNLLASSVSRSVRLALMSSRA